MPRIWFFVSWVLWMKGEYHLQGNHVTKDKKEKKTQNTHELGCLWNIVIVLKCSQIRKLTLQTKDTFRTIIKLHIKEMEKPTLVIAWNQIPKRKTIITNLSQMCYVHTPIVLEVFFHYVLTMLMVYITRWKRLLNTKAKEMTFLNYICFFLLICPCNGKREMFTSSILFIISLPNMVTSLHSTSPTLV
jgi:hypothetical protein